MASIPHSEQFAVVTFDVIANAPIAPKNTIGLADNGDRYISTGTGWVRTHVNGAARVRTFGEAGALDPRIITINADIDCITTANAPAADGSELYLLNNYTSGYKRCGILFIWNKTGTPYAGLMRIALNASGVADANDQVKLTDNNVGIANAVTASNKAVTISPTNPYAEFNLEGTIDEITSIYIGAHLSSGAGDTTCYAEVRVW